MNYLIACDPDTHNLSFAIFKDGRYYSAIKTETSIKEAVKIFDKYQPFILAIETQYSRFNIKTLIQLVEVRSMVETIARLDKTLGIYKIGASTWQKEVLNVPPKTKRDDRKKMSVESASKYIDNTLMDNDIADAINIGRYVLDNYEKLYLF